MIDKDPNKVRLTGSIEPDVADALEAFCRNHPKLSRSAVMAQALRRFLFPDYQEERERVLTENLDRLYWRQSRHAERVDRELRVIREMLALFVRTFYNHTPEVPPSERSAAAIKGEQRFSRFQKVLAEHLGPGKSALEQMPEEAVVTAEDAVAPDESNDEERNNASRS